MWAVPFASALFGAFVGGLVTFTVNLLKMRLDGYAARYEDLCKQILAAADLASEYWLLPVGQSNGAGLEKDERDRHAKARLLEARIQGLQQQTLITNTDLQGEMPRETRDQLAQLMTAFVDDLTGGNFLARSGDAHPQRATKVQITAAKLISEVRRGLRKKHSIGHLRKQARGQH